MFLFIHMTEEEKEIEELLMKIKKKRSKINSIAAREAVLDKILNHNHITKGKIAFEFYKKDGDTFEEAKKAKRVNSYISRFGLYADGQKKFTDEDLVRIKKIVKNEIGELVDLMKQL